MSGKTELLPCPFCGGEADVMLSQSRWGQSYTIHHDALGKCPAEYVSSMQFATEAEAIAAWNARAERGTLGSEPPYDELLRCLENDWHIHASWDGLRKFWCIELTEEGVRMRDAAHTERTCEIESSYLNDFTSEHECWYEFEMQCGYRFTWDEMEQPRCCPNCGARVVA